MQTTTYKVYWTYKDIHPNSNTLTVLTDALARVKELRDNPADNTFVTMVSEDTNRVGADGVDEVKDGKTPDGVPYTWNKASRIGATRR
jgi:hypothetical protein